MIEEIKKAIRYSIMVMISRKVENGSHAALDGKTKYLVKKHRIEIKDVPFRYEAYSHGVLVAWVPKFYDEEGEYLSIELFYDEVLNLV